jgi:hypothetical protein
MRVGGGEWSPSVNGRLVTTSDWERILAHDETLYASLDEPLHSRENPLELL